MTRIAWSALAILLLFPAASAAHRLDEYLQATRLSMTPDRVGLRLDLTPGVSIAAALLALIDRDHDNRVTPAEAHAYGRAVLAEIVLKLDGRELPLALNEVQVPTIDELRNGMGAIRVDASARLGGTSTGRHDLFFRNNHQPDVSIYLVNALMPDTRAVSIGRQERDPRQREFRLNYEVKSGSVAFAWTLAATLILGALTFSRRH